MYFANTHMHSTFSDGVHTPEKLIELGKEIGHKAMLLTDHDTISGQHRFNKAARKAGILTMMATEISALCTFGRCHIVCVDFNAENKGVRELLAHTAACTTELTHFLFEEGLQNGTLRKGISWQDVLDRYPDMDYICNNPVFDLMVEKGIYKYDEYEEFFNSTFNIPKPRKLELENITGYHHPQAKEAIDVILKADGVPIIAHPTENGRYFFKEEVDNFLKMGIKGFEVRHGSMSAEEREFYSAVCEKHGLYKMGGLDHRGILGGFCDRMPELCADPSEGYIEQEHFMKLYKRELG